MARDNDNNNDRPRGPRGPRRPGSSRDDRPARPGFKGRRDEDGGRATGARSGRASGPGGKPASGGKRSFGDKREGGEKRAFGEKRSYGEKRNFGEKREGGEKRAFGAKREGGRDDKRAFGDRPPRGPRKDFRSDERGDRPREDRAPRSGGGERGGWRDHPRSENCGSRGERSELRGAGGERPARAPRPRFGEDERPRRTHYRSEGVRTDAKEERYVKRPFKEDRLSSKRSAAPRDFGDRPREDRRRDDRPREDRPRSPRPQGDRPYQDRPREDRPRFARSDDRPPPRGPRKEFSRDDDRRPSRPPRREYSRDDERGAPRGPRREFTRDEGDRPARAPRKPFTRDDERGASRGPRRDFARPDRDRSERPARPLRVKKAGERIAKIVARAGLCSRRDAEEWITQGRVAVNGRIITSPALDVTAHDVVTIDGAVLPARERTRLFLYHKPRGLVTTHADPEGRPTVFDALPKDLPRLISVGRLDFNTEGLLLLTNDGGLARALELPDTGWLRRYRVRAHGSIDQAKLDALRSGIDIEGVNYGAIEATLDRTQGANVWITFAIREGKNREVRNVLAHLGLDVNRLIRVSYGPFQLGELTEGAVEEVKTRVLRDQLGERVAKLAGADFDLPLRTADDADTPTGKKRDDRPVKTTRAGLIADRKGRRVLVERKRTDEPEDEGVPNHHPSRRPPRHYHGKNERGGDHPGGRSGGSAPRKR